MRRQWTVVRADLFLRADAFLAHLERPVQETDA